MSCAYYVQFDVFVYMFMFIVHSHVYVPILVKSVQLNIKNHLHRTGFVVETLDYIENLLIFLGDFLVMMSFCHSFYYFQ